MDIFRATIESSRNVNKTVLGLFSDLHLDAADHDRVLLKQDLETAAKLNARISINGDMFDAIVPSDRKRHHPKVNDIDRDDIFNELVRDAIKLLSPYADIIDVIAPGNHERSVLKYHHIDLISMVVFGLNQNRSEKLKPIHQGSYRGFQQYSFKNGKARGGVIFSLFRHHGRGGSAPVTGGALDLDRIRKDFDADLYWIGHKHSNISRAFTRVSIGAKGKLKVKPQRAVISAGYKKKLSVEDPFNDGDIGDFGEQFYSLSEQGAQWVLIESDSHYHTNSAGFVNGLRWSIADSPYQLLSDGAA